MTRETNTNIGATLTRLSLGTVLLSHGILKIAVFTIPGTVAYFASLGLPPIAAYLTIFAEIAGGSAILLGLYTRLAALLSIPLLLGAVWALLQMAGCSMRRAAAGNSLRYWSS